MQESYVFIGSSRKTITIIRKYSLWEVLQQGGGKKAWLALFGLEGVVASYKWEAKPSSK